MSTRLPPPSRAHMIALANHAIARNVAVHEPPPSSRPAPVSDVMRCGQASPASSGIFPVATDSAPAVAPASAAAPVVEAPPELVIPAPTIMRAKLPSLLEAVPTAMIQVSPAFLDALRRVAPKKKISRVTYIVGLAMCMVVGVLAIDRSTRTFMVDEGHALVAKATGNSAAQRDAAEKPSAQ